MTSKPLSIIPVFLFSLFLTNAFAEIRLSSKTLQPRGLASTPSDASDDNLVLETNSTVGFNLVNQYNFGFVRSVTFNQQPNASFLMLFDTASSSILTFGQNFANFTSSNESISDESEPYGERLDYSYDDLNLLWGPEISTCPNNTNCTPAVLSYPLGNANVTQYTDTATVANTTLQNQTVSIASYVDANIINSMLIPGGIDGIYGIGLNENGTCPFLESLVSAGLITQKYFTLFVTYDPYNTDFLSELIVEGYDSQYLNDSSFEFVPLVDNSSWSINIDSIATDQTPAGIIGQNLTGTVSSGIPYIGLPSDLFEEFIQNLNSAGIVCDEYNGPACQCPDVDFSNFPTLYIQSGNVTFAIPPEAYLTFDGSAGYGQISNSSNNMMLQQENTNARILQTDNDGSDNDYSSDDDDSDDSDDSTDSTDSTDSSDSTDDSTDSTDDSTDESDQSEMGSSDTEDDSETYLTTNYGGAGGLANPFYGAVWLAPVYAYFPYDYTSYYNQSTPIIATGPITLNPYPYFRDLCWLNIQPLNSTNVSSNAVILGSPFLQTYYTLFDAENFRLGFGKTNQPVSLSIAGYQPPSDGPSESHLKYFLIGFGVLIILILFSIVLYCYCYKKREDAEEDANGAFSRAEGARRQNKPKEEKRKPKKRRHLDGEDGQTLIVDYRVENQNQYAPPAQVNYQPPVQGAYYASNQGEQSYYQAQSYQQGTNNQGGYQL